ncbi:class I SAM-dependent methyltransferase [Desulfofustis glycolicus]|uniref:Methyltransferase domain-containing protein n=1 Tax=Desulfofustis glycolicus DSM 9705 TaxID=1121409 RepID=A0A1M5Y6U1_9BACT|nr:class I SAM-dependent methyltransferase [Desulfofustis glycolicus]MCB2216851.1 class I SAM-dependent methyltransferase [Desulfobulbaceae bacterium]SHI07639.1 Methyltransferase domain-containing protein [Desulfofustis glycolicus DSM 9705]
MVDITVGKEDIDRVFSPYVKKRQRATSPGSIALLTKLYCRWLVKRLQKAVARKLLQQMRTTDRVRSGYEEKWSAFDYSLYTPESPRSELMEWRGVHYFANPYVKGRIQLLYLERIISEFRPCTVLEVGCGRGSMIVPLGRRFPEVRFCGLELTAAGVGDARRLCFQRELPREMNEYVPFPIPFAENPQMGFVQASGECIPFRDGSFDLVYTNQALEQMDHIKADVLSEIARVARKTAVFSEPFRDWNARGIRRNRVLATQYFSASIADLKSYGLTPIFVTEDMPSKVILHTGIVVAEKNDDALINNHNS